MNIALDAMGGDYGPKETVKAAIFALDEIKDLTVSLVGKEELILEELKDKTYDQNRLKIVNATQIIENKEKESIAKVVRKKKDASMNVALELVASKKADASVSSGNTGALVSASLFKLKRIEGVSRPAITTILPTEKGVCVLLDAGATADAKPEYLEQYAIMGRIYAKLLLGKENPKIALLNIGEEEGKGNEIARLAYQILDNNENFDFVGNIEARDIMLGDVDIIVTDGFTGNIVLKTAEGTAHFITTLIKNEIKKSFWSKLGIPFLVPVFRNMKKKIDYSEYGGAVILGLEGLSIKSHGSSDANALKNGIKAAYNFSKKDFIKQLKENIESSKN